MPFSIRHIAPFVLAAILFCSSCSKPIRQAATTSDSTRTITKYQVIETIRDTGILQPADSSLLEALLECDSLRQVQLKSIVLVKPGKNLKPADVTLNSNKLSLKCLVDSFSVWLAVKDRFESRSDSSFQKKQSAITNTQKVNYVTGWQWFQIWLGRFLLLLILLYAGWKWASKKYSSLKKLF